MIRFEDASFHEATVIALLQFDNSIEIRLDGVLIDGKKTGLAIQFFGIRKITKDGVLCDKILQIYGDGEVLCLKKKSENNMLLIVEWNEFEQHVSTTVAYEFYCERIEMKNDRPSN